MELPFYSRETDKQKHNMVCHMMLNNMKKNKTR